MPLGMSFVATSPLPFPGTTVDGASSARVARTTNMFASQLERHKLDAGLSPVRHVSLVFCFCILTLAYALAICLPTCAYTMLLLVGTASRLLLPG